MFTRNYSQEMMRGRNEPAFEWHSANLGVIVAHVHNKKGYWQSVIDGAVSLYSHLEFATKEDAMAHAMKSISEIAESLIKQTKETP